MGQLCLRIFWHGVGVVARGAAHPGWLGRCQVALALPHLFHSVDELVAAISLPAIDKVHQEILQGQARPEVELGQATACDALVTLQMALFAHSLAERMIQPFRIDNSGIHAF